MSSGRKVTAEQCRDMQGRLLAKQQDTLRSVSPKFPTQHFVPHTVENKNEKITHSLMIEDEPEEVVFNETLSHEEQYNVIKKAAETGNVSAHYHLGDTFLRGWWGVPKNEKAAIYHYQYAANKGYHPAMYQIAIFFSQGTHGFAQNQEEALKWYHQAAEHGSCLAQHTLAKRYEQGRGVPKDTTRAIQLYRQAAIKMGNYVQNELARNYLYGIGIFPKDIEEGVRWARCEEESELLRNFYSENRFYQPPFDTQQPRFSDSITFQIGAALATQEEKILREQISADFNELAREKLTVFDELLELEPAEKILNILSRLSFVLEKTVLFRLSDLFIAKDYVTEYLNPDLATIIMDFNGPVHRVISVKTKDCFEVLVDNLQTQLAVGTTKCPPGEKSAFDAAQVEIKTMTASLSGDHSEEEYRVGIQSLLSFLKKQAETISAAKTEATSSSSSSDLFKKVVRSVFAETCTHAIEKLPPYVQKSIHSLSKKGEKSGHTPGIRISKPV